MFEKLEKIWNDYQSSCSSTHKLYHTAVFEKTCATSQKNVKSHVFLDFQKNVKNIKKT